MPVLATIAAVNFLFGGSKEKASFLDPVGLRKKIKKLPQGENRTKAIAILDRLDRLAREHNAATDAVINAYITDVEKYETTTDQLEEDFEPLDQTRANVYRELVEVRQAMVEILSAKEWDKVFG